MARLHNRAGRPADEAAQGYRPLKRLGSEDSHQDERTAKRKRPHAEKTSQAAKKAKSTGYHVFPPAFWDNLSKVWLTPGALGELDRRNNSRPRPEFTRPDVCPKSLARFAKHGGPDLRHLRGYPEPKTVACDMSSGHSSTQKSLLSQSTRDASTPSKPGKRSSAYDHNFEQHLADHSIYPHLYDFPDNRLTQGPANLDGIRRLLLKRRQSLSPSRFTELELAEFQQKNRAISEGKIMRDVIPILTGDTDIPSEGQLRFINLDPLTEDTTVTPVPDYFDGALPGDVDKRVRGGLSRMIMPTKHAHVPVVANFFLEVKGPMGSTEVVRRQACYNGAYGARAMHRLQNYNKGDDPTYDGNAYTFSSTYHAGNTALQLYVHHMTAPNSPGGRPQYHMTKLRGFDMTDSCESFIQGATAFRNARDLARRHRCSFILDANARASQSDTVAPRGVDEAGEEGGPSHELASRDADDALQRHIADTTYEDDDDEMGCFSQYLSTENGSREPSQEYVALGLGRLSISLASSSTSSKRPGQSLSPPPTSKRTHLSTSRTHPGTARPPLESSTRGSSQSGMPEPDWVETYGRKGKVCFKDVDGHKFKTELKDWTE